MSITFYEAPMSSATPVAWALVIVASLVGYNVFGAGGRPSYRTARSS
ncbi:MAG TPA: hypothetical protein VER33_12560 [Polyangiaceae bacterium]|nr:hypothetical protein [Polyangiaceae bacterium]